MVGFNYAFYEEHGKELISILQKSEGCFACRKPNPTKRCSRCKVAMYCSQSCQMKDWKKATGHHKELCGIWCDNRGSGPEDEDGSSIPICMKSCGYLPDDLMLLEMRRRGDLFIDEIKRCVGAGEIGYPILSFQTACIWNLGSIRLGASASFYSRSLSKVVVVNHVLFDTVDEGEDAKQRLHPSNEGSGEISEKAKGLVVAKWTEFVGRISERGLRVQSITYGRGLMWLSEDEAATKRIEESNGGVDGEHRSIMWLPSMDHAMRDSFNDAVMGTMPHLAGMLGTLHREGRT